MSKFIITTLILLGSFLPSHSFSKGLELAYQGYNAYSMSLGFITEGNPEHFLIIEDRVFYFVNEKNIELFEEDLEKNIKKADKFFISLQQ